MNIYGIILSTVIHDDGAEVSKEVHWDLVKVARQGDRLIWQELSSGEIEKNGWANSWLNLYYADAGASLDHIRQIFNFPYVGETFEDQRYPLPLEPTYLEVDPIQIIKHYSGDPS